MSYQGGDDPQLIDDLRTALKRWRRPTLGDVPLATHLSNIERRRAADPRLSQAEALRETLQAALARMRDEDLGAEADLLHQRYAEGLSVYRLQDIYNLSERSIHYRLHEALAFLAQALWSLEQPASLPAAAEPVPAWWRARHLPPPTYTSLFGVHEALASLLHYLAAPDEHWMISVEGMGGLGKTAVVREAASIVAGGERFSDIVWLTVEAECYVPDVPPRPLPPTCDQVLDGIGAQLAGLELASLPREEKRSRVGALLRARPILVVVDNLEMVTDSEEVLESLRGLANPSKFVVTSRRRMEVDRYPWTVVRMDALTEQDSLSLLRHEGQLRGLRDLAEASDDELRPICEVTGGNPLAIKLVVGQLVSRPLGRVLADLAGARPGTDAFYDYLFRASWVLLSAPAQHLLMRMAALPPRGSTWRELAATSGLVDGDLEPALAQLTVHSLLESTGLEDRTYTIHPLTRHFVAHQAALQG